MAYTLSSSCAYVSSIPSGPPPVHSTKQPTYLYLAPSYVYQPPVEPIHVCPLLRQPSHYPPHSPASHLPMGQHSYQVSRDSDPNYYQPSHHSHLPPPIQSPYPFISSVNQPPPTPHPDTALGKYALFLRACYTQHGCSSTKWPPLDAVNYVNLAVISSEYANKEELLKFRQQTIHGSIDDILEWKAPIAMQDILKPKYRGQEAYPVTQLLIEGAPGIGKSTFAWEVCQKWGQRQLFNEFSLVVLLRFRDKRVHNAETMSDLFYHPLAKLQSEIVNHICSTGGRGLLILLEGFDEAPASSNPSRIQFLLGFLEDKNFPKPL